MTAFRVYSGWDKRQADAAEVFAYSVMENASIKVYVDYVAAGDGPGNVLRRQGVTSFSYARFAVPYLRGFKGRALFADGCDQLCLGDVAELAEFDMQGKPIAVVKHPPIKLVPRLARARSWTSLMLMDCAQLTKWTPAYVQSAPDDVLMRLRDVTDDQIGELPGEWNALVEPGQEPPEGTKIAHYSALSDPNGGDWITRSRSTLWAEWLERWREARNVA